MIYNYPELEIRDIIPVALSYASLCAMYYTPIIELNVYYKCNIFGTSYHLEISLLQIGECKYLHLRNGSVTSTIMEMIQNILPPSCYDIINYTCEYMNIFDFKTKYKLSDEAIERAQDVLSNDLKFCTKLLEIIEDKPHIPVVNIAKVALAGNHRL